MSSARDVEGLGPHRGHWKHWAWAQGLPTGHREWSGAGISGKEVEGVARMFRVQPLGGVTPLPPTMITYSPSRGCGQPISPGSHSAMGWGEGLPCGPVEYSFHGGDRRHFSGRTFLNTLRVRPRPSCHVGGGVESSVPKHHSPESVSTTCPQHWAGRAQAGGAGRSVHGLSEGLRGSGPDCPGQ